MNRVVLVGGARPNFMKIAPVLSALERRGVEVVLVHTGQHYDDSMSATFFRDLSIREPDIRLEVGSGSHASQTAKVMESFEPVLATVKPDAVIVVGDVNSTLACALVAAKTSLPVAHVEAGLRSYDRSMPEEVNRLCTDTLSDWLFAPSMDAYENLLGEGIDASRVFLVGNVMADSLLAHRNSRRPGEILRGFGLASDYGILTLHRPVNVDNRERLAGILEAIEVIQASRQILFPVHPRTRASLERFQLADLLATMRGLRMMGPLGYSDMLGLLASAAVVLTDSGGIQEETTMLGVPCLTLRENTERPITVTEGTNQVVGTDPSAVLAAYTALAKDHLPPRRPALWDGMASERIADVLTSTGVTEGSACSATTRVAS